MALSHSPKIVTDGLVLCLDAANPRSYPGTGTTWSDLSGNGNNGTLVNGVGYSNNNLGSMIFDGINNVINYNQSITSGDFSFEVWSKLFLQSNENSLLDHNSSSGVLLMSSGSSTLGAGYRFLVRKGAFQANGANQINLIGTDIRASTNTWVHHVGTYEDSVYTAKMYINGELVDQDSNINAQGFSILTGDKRIGLSASNRYFNGLISIAKIYNRALSEAEIKQNFEATRDRYGI